MNNLIIAILYCLFRSPIACRYINFERYAGQAPIHELKGLREVTAVYFDAVVSAVFGAHGLCLPDPAISISHFSTRCMLYIQRLKELSRI